MVISWAHESSQHVGISSSVWASVKWCGYRLNSYNNNSNTMEDLLELKSREYANYRVFLDQNMDGQKFASAAQLRGKSPNIKRRNWTIAVGLSFKLHFTSNTTRILQPIPLAVLLPRPFCDLAKQANLRNNHRGRAIPTAPEGNIRKSGAVYV